MQDEHTSGDHLTLAAEIVAAYVTRNSLPAAEVPAFIRTVHASLLKVAAGTVEAPPPVAREPAVSIKKSITNDHIICLEDGKKFKSLKRHLATAYNLTPEAYRTKWGLPSDYPMVAPAYAAQRSELAKAAGLGNARAAARAPKVADEPAPKKRAPSKKAA